VSFGSSSVLDKSVDNVVVQSEDPAAPDADVPDEEPSPPDADIPDTWQTHPQTIVTKDATTSVVIRKPKNVPERPSATRFAATFSAEPSTAPSISPSASPSAIPSAAPSATPSTAPSSSTPTKAPQAEITVGQSKDVLFESSTVLDKSADNVVAQNEVPAAPDVVASDKVPAAPDADVPVEDPAAPDADVPNAWQTHTQKIVSTYANTSLLVRKPKTALQMSFLRKKRATAPSP
jgi:hypothetical protein